MKVLYGVQATGNGHITRARVMAPALEKAGVDVDYLFSGRDPEELFNMEPFGAYQCRQGLTFYMEGSKVNQWKTFTGNNPIKLVRDIFALNLDQYDLVITDFEPVTAWAAKLTICPPLIQAPLFDPVKSDNKVVVYLPHDNVDQICRALQLYTEYEFFVYARVDKATDDGNMHVRPFSRDGFHRDLSDCSGVICNSGFGLLSEAIQYGKKILTLPQVGQAEQESNAEILEYLGLGIVIDSLQSERLAQWLALPMPEPKVFPDLATILAEWIAAGCNRTVQSVVDDAWNSSYSVTASR